MCACGLTGVTEEVNDEVMVGESSSTASNEYKFVVSKVVSLETTWEIHHTMMVTLNPSTTVLLLQVLKLQQCGHHLCAALNTEKMVSALVINTAILISDIVIFLHINSRCNGRFDYRYSSSREQGYHLGMYSRGAIKLAFHAESHLRVL